MVRLWSNEGLYMQEVSINTPVEAITRQRRAFSTMRAATLSAYLEQQKQNISTPTLLSLNGWGDWLERKELPAVHLPHVLVPEAATTIMRSGGYWLCLGGVGIVINPGQEFLNRFHEAGLHMWDINHVIVTDSQKSSSIDLEPLWNFNREMNSLLKEWQLTPHTISYWLHPESFERYIPVLRPTSREERDSIHRLQPFPENNPFETVEFTPQLHLDFCATHAHTMVRLRSDEEQVGCLFHAPYEPLQTEFLSPCSLLLLGMGESTYEEISTLEPSENTLGLAGVAKILKGSSARLALISEQGFSEGDTRIESLKKLRTEIPSLPILPTEIGARYHLDSLSMSGPGVQTPIPIGAVRSMRRAGPFSELTFCDDVSIL